MPSLKINKRIDANSGYFNINLGDRVVDNLTGFTGLVVARTEYLTGCSQILVLPNIDKNSEYPNGVWIDVERLDIVDKCVVKIVFSPSGMDCTPPKNY